MDQKEMASMGGKARAKKLTKKQRIEHARKWSRRERLNGIKNTPHNNDGL
jgi:hypothetical protein